MIGLVQQVISVTVKPTLVQAVKAKTCDYHAVLLWGSCYSSMLSLVYAKSVGTYAPDADDSSQSGSRI